MAKITKAVLKDILQVKGKRTILYIYFFLFNSEKELIDDIVDNHSEERLTQALKSFGWDFEVISNDK